MVVSGWGRTSQRSHSEIKKKIVNYLVSNDDCEKFYKNYNIQIKPTQLCLNEADSGDINCVGDSGSPVMYSYRNQWQVEGINSFGPYPCGPGQLTLHTRVSEYIEWLRINMHV